MKAAKHRYQLRRIGRFDNVRIGPKIISTIDIPFFAGRTEHHSHETFQFGSRSDIVQQIKAAFPWHLDIKKQKVWKWKIFSILVRRFAQQITKRLFRIVKKAWFDWEARFVQGAFEQENVVRIIFGDEHTRQNMPHLSANKQALLTMGRISASRR
jgi:hypothetical protein